jgi:hypothetical protein
MNLKMYFHISLYLLVSVTAILLLGTLYGVVPIILLLILLYLFVCWCLLCILELDPLSLEFVLQVQRSFCSG